MDKIRSELDTIKRRVDAVDVCLGEIKTNQEQIKMLLQQVLSSNPQDISALVDEKTSVGLEEFNLRSKLLAQLSGELCVIKDYLSENNIRGGKGQYEKNKTIVSYSSDLNRVLPTTIASWPNGFYTDSETKETQFLIVGKRYLYLYTGLPGSSPLLNLFKIETAVKIVVGREDTESLQGILNELVSELEDILK